MNTYKNKFKFVSLIIASLVLTSQVNTYAFSLFQPKESKSSKFLKPAAIIGFVGFWIILAILANSKKDNKGGENPNNTSTNIFPLGYTPGKMSINPLIPVNLTTMPINSQNILKTLKNPLNENTNSPDKKNQNDLKYPTII